MIKTREEMSAEYGRKKNSKCLKDALGHFRSFKTDGLSDRDRALAVLTKANLEHLVKKAD